MELNLNDKWVKTTGYNPVERKTVDTGFELIIRNIDRNGGIRIYHTLTEDCTWLHVNAHRVFQDSHEERIFTLNIRIYSQDEFDTIIKSIHDKYLKQEKATD